MPLFHEPACLFVITKGIIPKKHSLKRALPTASFASERLSFVPPPACGEIALENSVVHCIAAYPSYPTVRRATPRQWPAPAAFLFPSECAMRLASFVRFINSP